MLKFYVGLHQPSDAKHFERAFISINRLRGRRSSVLAREWILDSGAFRELEHFGGYRHTPEEFAVDVNRIAALNPTLSMVVSQDYMCEPMMLAKTGLTVLEHQQKTIERYDALKFLIHIPLMPVLQGYSLSSYLDHVDQYGDRLRSEMVVGVGSICKRNGNPEQVQRILCAIKWLRPTLRLHGFGLKTTALQNAVVRACLYSADSMAWSFAARREGRDRNSWREAAAFEQKITALLARDNHVGPT